jgi:hypothetical protein
MNGSLSSGSPAQGRPVMMKLRLMIFIIANSGSLSTKFYNVWLFNVTAKIFYEFVRLALAVKIT